jgi:hypothetical protein
LAPVIKNAPNGLVEAVLDPMVTVAPSTGLAVSSTIVPPIEALIVVVTGGGEGGTGSGSSFLQDDNKQDDIKIAAAITVRGVKWNFFIYSTI